MYTVAVDSAYNDFGYNYVQLLRRNWNNVLGPN